MPGKFIEIAVVWLYILCIHSAYCKIWGQIWPAHMEGWSQDTWCELTDFDDFFFLFWTHCTLLSLLGEVQKMNRTGIQQADIQPVGKSTKLDDVCSVFMYTTVILCLLRAGSIE